MVLSGKNIDKKELLLHIAFWLSWVVSFTIIQSLGTESGSFTLWLYYYLITLPVFAVHTYLIAYWLIPQTFFKGKHFQLILGLIFLLFLFSVIELVISNEFVFNSGPRQESNITDYLNVENILISGIGNHYIIIVFLAIKVGRSWHRSKNEKEELQKFNLETQTEIYRYQLQPRIIYYLMDQLEEISKTKPEKSSEMIIKISGFLNQLVYECNEELIPLDLEVKLISEFLGIHKLALDNRFQSNFEVSGNIKSHVVPPLLLLPFLENAIKIMYKCNETFESTVFIKGEKNYLLFSSTVWSENDFEIADKNDLEIIEKRLKLVYAGKHKLIENTDSNFREISIEIFN